MPNLVNLTEVLTYLQAEQEFRLSPGQAWVRGGRLAQPFLGATRDRPEFGQVWPRGEYEATATIGANQPEPPAFAVTVTVEPEEFTIDLAGPTTQQLTVRAFDEDGNELFGHAVSYVSSAPGFATVSTTGLVSPVAEGNATISAVVDGAVGTALCHVFNTPPAVDHVTVVPATFSVGVGATKQLNAFAFDASNNLLTGRTITWDSSDDAIATVSASGLVTGVSVGSVTITATCETIDGTSAGTVLPAGIIAGAIIYLSMNETSGTTVTSTGSNTIALTAEDESIVDGESGKARQTTDESGRLFTGSEITSDHAGPTFLQQAGNRPWTVAAFIDRSLGEWFDIEHSTDPFAQAGIIGNDSEPNHPRCVPLMWQRPDVFGTPSRLITEYDPDGTVVTHVWMSDADFGLARTHVCIVNDPTNDRYRLYINGSLFQNVAGAINVASRGDGIVRFCSQIGQGWGWIDEFYLFDRALTAAEVSTLASV